MKTARLLALLGVGLVAGAAFAINVNIVGIPTWFKAGAWIGPSSTLSTANKITSSYGGFCSWDFPAVGGGSTVCSTSATCAATGVNFGDNCIINSNFGQDGGLPMPPGLALRCHSRVDGVTFELCNFAADAGGLAPIDIADSGFFFTTFGHR